jgi:hypothetical protein
VVGGSTPDGDDAADEEEAAPAPSPLAARLVQGSTERHSANGQCSVSVLYPQLAGMANTALQKQLNRYLLQRWIDPVKMSLQTVTGACPIYYLSSSTFQAWLSQRGILSVKRTLAIQRGAASGTLVQECHLLDLKHGGRLDVAHLLGVDGLSRLTELTQKALQKRAKNGDLTRLGIKQTPLRLAKGNFSACTDGHNLIVELGAALLADEHTAVEVAVPLSALGRPGLTTGLGL